MAHRVHGQLVAVGGGDPIPLIRESLTLGRLDSCDITMRLPNVSKRHCRLTFEKGFWWIEDLNSTNGIKINGMRINSKRILHPDDRITLAKRDYTIEYDPPVGQSALEELMEDDPMSQPLLEKAGLLRPRRFDRQTPRKITPIQRELDEDDDEDD